MPPSNGIRIYRSDARFGVGPLGALRALIEEVAAYRSHIGTLFWSEFRGSYQGTAFGIFWNLALPLIPISVYILLVSLRVFPRFEDLSPAVFISFNATLWFLLIGFVQQPIHVVKSRNASLMKTAIPLSAALVSSFARLFFDTLIRMALVTALILTFQDWLSFNAWMAILAVLAGVVLSLSIGMGLAVLNAIYPDIERIVAIVLQYGIFLSGVIFPLSTMPQLALLETLNPFNVFIQAARDVAFLGALSHPFPFWAWTAAGVLLLIVSLRFFYVMEYRLRDLS